MIFYLRGEPGTTCGGRKVFGHWLLMYNETDRSRYDANIGRWSKTLDVGRCG